MCVYVSLCLIVWKCVCVCIWRLGLTHDLAMQLVIASERIVVRGKVYVTFLHTKKICKQNKKRRIGGCSTKKLGLLTTDRDMRLLTGKRTVLIVCAPIKWPWWIPSLYLWSLMCIRPSGSYNPTMHCPLEATPFLFLRGYNFDIFFSLGLMRN